MARPDRPMDRYPRDVGLNMDTFSPDGRDWGPRSGPMSGLGQPVQSFKSGYSGGQTGQGSMINGQQPPGAEETKVYSPRVYQNAEAIKRYNLKEKRVVRHGNQAAALEQVHQNNLHSIETAAVQPPQADSKHRLPNGMMADGKGQPPSRQMKNFLNLQGQYESRSQPSGLHHRPIVGPHKRGRSSQRQDMSTSFDPMKDRHMWTMWRTAVNGRIVDEVREIEKVKIEQGPEAYLHPPTSLYGRALVAPPLKRFIKFDNDSRELAQQLSNLGQGQLQASQFVYYGLPRVVVTPNNRDFPK